MLTALRRILQLIGLGQSRCLHCATPFFPAQLPENSISQVLCPLCQKLLAAYHGPACRICGLPGAAAICPACKRKRPPWLGSAAYGLYEGALRDLLLRLKFSGEIRLARLLAEFLLQACQKLPRPDLLLPIPQHPGRLYERGYNQAHEIGRQFAKLSALPLGANLLLRARPGIAQEALTAQERRKNLLNAFHAKAEVRGKVIWLIDDVLTTGSTCEAATTALLAAGAKNIWLLTVARTPLRQDANANSAYL